MTPKLLSIRNLKKVYPNGSQALKGVSFDVEKGEFLVVIGLSGSGKSTLLRCINRLVEPSSGDVFFDGVNVLQAQPNKIKFIRTQIGMIFQHFNLIPRYSVLSNVLMGQLGRISSWKSIFGFYSSEQKNQALELLSLVGIREKARIRADQLSGGQQQRVAIARALNQNPRVLLADEPVASLDPSTSHSIMDYLKKANQEMGITVICNLHFLSLVRQYATRVIALKEGEIVFQGSPEEINEEWFKRIYGEEAKEIHAR